RSTEEQRLAGFDQLRQGRNGLMDAHVGATVQNHPDGAVLVMMPDEHDGTSEVRVPQRWAGDEQLAAEGLHPGILTSATCSQIRPNVQLFAGICFFGSRNGSSVTIADIEPSGDSIVIRVPAGAFSIGTQTYPMLNSSCGEYEALTS